MFNDVFNYIKATCDHYGVFSIFYDIRYAESSEDTHGQIAQRAINAANDALDNTLQKKENEFNDRIDKATEEKMRRLQNMINKKSQQLTEKVSETSVTILGIFAGIVLAVVAGLFYSSSVLESVNSARFDRLLVISIVVGFVCINILAVMFDYITKIRRGDRLLTSIREGCFNLNSSWGDRITTYNYKLKDIDNVQIIERQKMKKHPTKCFFECVKNHLFVIIIDAILIIMMIFTIVVYKPGIDNNISKNIQQTNHISSELNTDAITSPNDKEIISSPTSPPSEPLNSIENEKDITQKESSATQ